MSDFLLELRSEEIPARMQAGARADLEKLFRAEMEAAGVSLGELTVWSTPRRLALIARGLPEATEAVSEEAKGPPEGAPDQAIDGFCRKNGVTRDQLEVRDVKGKPTYFAVRNIPGRAVTDVLAEAIPAIIRAFPWPKSMRWGEASLSTESLRWVRPLSGIVAIFGDNLVACEIDGISSGFATKCHRFHCPGDITIGSADDYAEKLRACHVIVDHEERQDIVRAGAAKVASEAGLVLVEDEGLVIENAGLTEWPVPLLGRFDEAFLEVPPEVIQLTARTNQKYFICKDPPRNGGVDAAQPQTGGNVPLHRPSDGPPPRTGEEIANAFVCTANIVADDGGAAIVDGNRKVLAARLSDARFFWDVDRKTTLAEQARKLERITFHEKLGTVADKVERVAKLARWLVEEGIVAPDLIRGKASSGAAQEGSPTPASAGVTKEELADLAEQAARLCKADLVTEMVGEFPELQGLMGGYYARAEGLPDAVADAIRDHYKPVGQGDEVPTAPVTVAVSLADKLDTLAGFFAIDERPTGSKDPFALRRAVLGIIRQINAFPIRMALQHAIAAALNNLRSTFESKDHWEVYPDDEATMGSLYVGDIKTAYYNLDLEYAAFDVKRFVREVESETEIPEGDHLTFVHNHQRVIDWLLDFFADRLKVQQREAGVRHDLIDAVFALGGEDDLVRLLARVHALQSFIGTEDGANLLAAYKRAANILKKEDWPTVTPAQTGVQLDSGLRRNDETGRNDDGIEHTGDEDPLENVDDPDMRAVYAAAADDRKALSYTPEKAEKALIEALDAAEPKAEAAVAAEDFEGAMAALASLRAPIDAFFDEVTVNDADKEKRSARLDLLARFRAAVHKVADFAKIEG